MDLNFTKFYHNKKMNLAQNNIKISDKQNAVLKCETTSMVTQYITYIDFFKIRRFQKTFV